MRNIHHRWILPILFLIGSALACQLNLGGPTTPVEATSVPTVSVEELQNDLENTAITQEQDGSITISLTESQLKDLLSYELSQIKDPVVTDPQVVLNDGQVEVFCTIQTDYLSGNADLVIEVSADDDGKPVINFVSAKVGPMPIPNSVLDGISSMIIEGFTSEIGSYATGFRIDHISIENGLMTITGKGTSPN